MGQISMEIMRLPGSLLSGNQHLASLKQHLGLVFEYHDAGEDARASAEVVLRAEIELLRPSGQINDICFNKLGVANLMTTPHFRSD